MSRVIVTTERVEREEHRKSTRVAGDEGRVRERIEVYKEVGVTYLNIDIPGDTENPLEVIEKVKAWAE